jgi:glutathione S-transferase
MKLYVAPASPFVRKVLIVLHETGLIGQTELVPASGNAVDPGTMPVSLNPLGKIPTLVSDEGKALYDSRVIGRYLNDLAGADLFPGGPALWDALALEAAGDGICDAAVLCVYEKRLRPDEKYHAPWVEGQWAKIARTLDWLERDSSTWVDQPFHIGHAALAAALGYLDLRLSDRSWPAERPALAAWFSAISQRPSVKATIPSG